MKGFIDRYEGGRFKIFCGEWFGNKLIINKLKLVRNMFKFVVTSNFYRV